MDSARPANSSKPRRPDRPKPVKRNPNLNYWDTIEPNMSGLNLTTSLTPVNSSLFIFRKTIKTHWLKFTSFSVYSHFPRLHAHHTRPGTARKLHRVPTHMQHQHGSIYTPKRNKFGLQFKIPKKNRLLVLLAVENLARRALFF